jgi:transcriptional regulator with XRE-family HTH domain
LNAPRTPPANVLDARRSLGARLREIRTEAGLTGRALATATGMHYTKVSRLENGRQQPTEADIRSWCSACGHDAEVPELVATLRGIEGMWVEWKRHLRGGLKHLQKTFDQYLNDATTVKCYESVVVPGILQTAAYAEAVLAVVASFYDCDRPARAAIQTRIERQRFLYRGDRRFSFVLERPALHTVYGDADTMLGQLDRLLSVMSLPSVSLGIIPAGPPRRMFAGGGFWIFDDRLCLIETLTAEVKIIQPREIALARRAFRNYQTSAVYGAEARTEIHAAMRCLSASPRASSP